jgi:hypothetical protein
MKSILSAIRRIWDFVRDLSLDGYGAVSFAAPLISITFALAKFFDVPLVALKSLSYAWGLLPICLWFLIGYARRRAMSDRSRKIRKLKEFYAGADPIIHAQLEKTISEEDFKKYTQSADSWANNCATWIEAEMGQLAKARYLDRSGMQDVSITGAVNISHNTVVRNVTRFKANLLAMIETPSCDQD